MKQKAGETSYDFQTFQSMDLDHQRVLAALTAAGQEFLAGVPVQVEVEFREVDRAPVQDYWFPEPSMTPEEFDRKAREAGREFLAGPINPESIRDHTRCLAELVRLYQDVRFTKGAEPVGGAFRPGLITIYLFPGQRGEALTSHVISTLAHGTYHAASFKVADRRRTVLRQRLNYQDDRCIQAWEEIMACLYVREVCRLAGFPGEGEGYGVTQAFLSLGDFALARVGQSFAGMNGMWLLTNPAAQAFWDAQGDILFRSLHMNGARLGLTGGRR